ncbi:V-set and immunoglobulin domain-containing protein 2, partial [Ophiophagus hannah]
MCARMYGETLSRKSQIRGSIALSCIMDVKRGSSDGTLPSFSGCCKGGGRESRSMERTEQRDPAQEQSDKRQHSAQMYNRQGPTILLLSDTPFFVLLPEKPSTPHCSISGKVFLGNEITLRCASQTGTPPLMYRWTKMSDYPLESGLPANTMAGKIKPRECPKSWRDGVQEVWLEREGDEKAQG